MTTDDKAVEQIAERIVAENIDAWRWGPLEEIEGLSEHRLAIEAAKAGYLAGIASLTQPKADEDVVERVARAIVEVRAKEFDDMFPMTAQQIRDSWHQVTDEARAAIAAMSRGEG